MYTFQTTLPLQFIYTILIDFFTEIGMKKANFNLVDHRENQMIQFRGRKDQIIMNEHATTTFISTLTFTQKTAATTEIQMKTKFTMNAQNCCGWIMATIVGGGVGGIIFQEVFKLSVYLGIFVGVVIFYGVLILIGFSINRSIESDTFNNLVRAPVLKIEQGLKSKRTYAEEIKSPKEIILLWNRANQQIHKGKVAEFLNIMGVVIEHAVKYKYLQEFGEKASTVKLGMLGLHNLGVLTEKLEQLYWSWQVRNTFVHQATLPSEAEVKSLLNITNHLVENCCRE